MQCLLFLGCTVWKASVRGKKWSNELTELDEAVAALLRPVEEMIECGEAGIRTNKDADHH